MGCPFIICRIDSTVDDLETLKDISHGHYDYPSKLLKEKLRDLRTFVLCARKWSNDEDNSTREEHASLNSLLLRVEDAVCNNATEIHSYCFYTGGEFVPEVQSQIFHFTSEIKAFQKDMDEGYITLSDYSWLSSPPKVDHVMEVTGSVLKYLVEKHSELSFTRQELLAEALEALGEKIKFLMNFIRFATLAGVEHGQLEDLLTHTDAVAVNAAYLGFMCGFKVNDGWDLSIDREFSKKMQFKISGLLQDVSPTDPQVSQTYTQALSSSKVSRKLHAPTTGVGVDPIIITRDFVHSLVYHLWEMLQLDSDICLVVSMKDQLQVLYEGLRFLRTIVRQQPHKFEKIADLAGVLICDAGVVIFLLARVDVNIDLQLLDLLERIKVIRTEVEEEVSVTSTFDVPNTNELGFVDFLLEALAKLTASMSDSNAQNCLNTILVDLDFLRSFLKEIVDLRNEQDELQSLWNRVVEVARRIEFLIDPLVAGEIPNSFSTSLDSITDDIGNIKADALKISNGKRLDSIVQKLSRTPDELPSKRNASMNDDVVGFDDEATSIINRLTRGSKQLRIIAIAGMPGIGKTTLATRSYNDPSVIHHFHVRAWCSVSQVFDKKKVLLELLVHIITKLPDNYFKMNEEDLADVLRRHLKGRRYLIFLDDIWDIEAWNRLAGSLPDDSNQSRIILTSRVHDVAPQAMLDEEPHFLRQLSKDESLELLQRKLFPGKVWPAALYELGMQIAENCKGLPLTIIIVAGLLATMELEDWKQVVVSLSSGSISTAEQFTNTLELSFKHLPDDLKPCFLYLGAFPEDQEISIKMLIRLWIAEGFVHKTNSRSLEDVAIDYMTDLLGRSLIIVAKQRSIGGAKTCRVHDLLHDFCIRKAQEENFFQLLQSYDELLAFHGPCNMLRLCIHSEPKHFKESRLFCPRVCSLLHFTHSKSYEPYLDISFVIRIFKLVEVLDIGEINVGYEFPSEIELLVRLKYLAVRGQMTDIPSSIGNLSNLETFIVNSHSVEVSLPDTLWNLQKLRNLCICSRVYLTSCGFILPTENLDDDSYNLYKLETFSGALIYCWHCLEKQMRKFPNIRKLKCVFSRRSDQVNEIVVPEFLSELESLEVTLPTIPDNPVFKFGFPVNLKKLTLTRFGLPWSEISAIGELPNLEVLKLTCYTFSGETWNVEDGQFLRLRFLKLYSLDVVRWTASEDQFPNLQKLVLDKCKNLEEIPWSCLESNPTLEMIQVSNCPDCIVSSVQQIQDVQKEMGNRAMKILIQSSDFF